MELSIATHFAWQLAVTESLKTKQQYIEKEHIFNGICSLDKVTTASTVSVNLSKDSLNSIYDEKHTVEKIFANFDLNPLDLCLQVRNQIGEGKFLPEGRIVHRSADCKTYFKKAEEIATNEGSNQLNCLHLLATIMSNPGPKIAKVLNSYGVKANQVEEKIINSKIESNRNFDTNLGVYTILGNFGTDLTQQAREGNLEPVISRDGELLKLIRTLKKKKKSNPIIVGDPGVGKTALVRGLAQRISEENVPPSLRHMKIVEMNMGSLVAGTKFRGDFENRINQMIAEMREKKDVIVFIDEIHNVVGAGKAEGSIDASDILKPALAEGDITIIGATTIAEYRKYFEKDSAMERRFQPIMIDEPTIDQTINIIQGLRTRYEEYHNVKISDNTIQTAVELSVRYITDRRLPDKALDIIDEACSSKTIPDLSMYMHNEVEITIDDVINVIRDWTQIPIRADDDEKEKLINMENELKKRVIGQDEAIKKVSRIIKRARMGIHDPQRPLGVFFFLGPTGVGKTELAKSIADFMFYSEKSIIRLDMSEFMDSQSISKLIGSPPGMIGYEEGGYLTNALRTKPYSIVLLDEIEKAHPQVFDLFLQVFDEGRITDSHSRTIDARHAIFILTSNIQITEDSSGVAYGVPDSEFSIPKNTIRMLQNYFRLEFLNRIDEIIPFNHLGIEQVEEIVQVIDAQFRERVLKESQIQMELEPKILSLIAKKGYDPDYGARYLIKTYRELVDDPLVDEILRGNIVKGDKVRGLLKKDKIVFKEI